MVLVYFITLTHTLLTRICSVMQIASVKLQTIISADPRILLHRAMEGKTTQLHDWFDERATSRAEGNYQARFRLVIVSNFNEVLVSEMTNPHGRLYRRREWIDEGTSAPFARL